MITYGSITLTSYNSIVTTIIYYYQSISPTDLIGGTWSTTKPEWEEGTYVWQKLRTIYEDGTFSEGDAVNITGQQGKSGEAASSYKLTSSESAIALLKTGEYSTNQITFSATYKQGNNPIAPYNGGFIIQHSTNGAEWVTDYTSLSNESSKTYTVPENILIIKCLLYQTKDCDELLDIVTVPIIKDGIDGTGVTNSFPIYLVSDKDKGITLDDHGWTRFKPSLDAENKYLWIDYISRYAEGNIKPQLIEKTGNKITFEYHGERSPFESVIIDITPVQSGSGTPSSGNKRHISGWTSIDIGQADINLMPYEEGKYMLDLPEDIGTLDNRTLNLKNTMFTIQGDTLIITKGDLGTHIVFPEEVGTVYGGKYNVTTGVLMVTHGYIDKYNNEPLPSTWISDRNVYVKGTKPSVGAQVVFKLNEPLIYELTPQEIMIFEHSNSIYASTGDISISYYDYQTTTSPYIDYALVSAFDASTAALEEATQLKQDFQELQEDIQTQLDQKVETWCQINDPALSWTTADLKQQHNGDLWYYTGESNMSYKNNTTYKYVASTNKWMPYAVSADLFDKIDTKTTIYYGQTTDRYPNVESGDYLVDSTDGSTYRYENDQWIKVTDYASAINELEQEINNMQKDLQSQIDGKVQTWYQPTDPALNWSTEEKQNHVGDLWFNSSATVMKTYRYNGDTWNEQTVSKAVFDQIDGKAQVFINTPTPPYQTGDIWFNSDTSEIMTCIADRANGSYTASDWEKRNKYTDDTKATEANNKVTSVYGTCNTTAGTTVKVVVCPNFVLFEGARIQVTFTNANTANAPTLNINNTGAKPIYINKTVTSSSNLLLWTAGSKMEFVYDGTGWIAQNVPYALYGTCSTGASTAAKAVTCNEAVICKGTTISVNMTNTNTAANATMNVGSTVAKDIYANDAKLTTNSRFNWRANTVQKFVFDGQVWRMDDDSVKALATAYITEIDNDGIMVHPENDTTSGWSIASAIELFKSGISYIKLWIDNNIPKIRIGREDQGHLILDNDSVNVMENTNNNLASFGKETTIGGENSSRFVLSPNEITGQYKDGNESFHIYNYYTTKTGEKDIIENQKISPYSQSNNGNTFQYTLQNAPIIDPQGTINIIVIGYNNNKEEIASASQTLEYKYFYDSSNNPIRLTVNGEVFEEWTYDENGNLIGVDEYHSAIEGISYDISGDRPQTGDIFEIRYEPFLGRYVVVTTSSNITSINLQVSYITLAEIQIPNPYYTFGSRLGVSQGSYSFTVGKNNTASAECSVALGACCKANANYSYAEGKDTTASGYYSHAEGYETASGSAYTHAEGCRTIASSPGSHAEGQETTASGSWSHAEGYATTASGNHSHAQNYGTQALSYAQTTMGKWNIADNTEKYALIIGNGSNNSRSNALTVAWEGNVEMALDTTASSGTTDADLYDAITALGWGNDVLI